MQPKTPLFTSGSQHPLRFGHAVYLGVIDLALIRILADCMVEQGLAFQIHLLSMWLSP